MKKINLLHCILLSVCTVSACQTSLSSTTDKKTFFEDNEELIIDTTTQNTRCGVDGISCNDSALVNYTTTETDYRAYGERTEKDFLYTNAATGNNVTSTIRPTIEDDVVGEEELFEATSTTSDDDIFSNTSLDDVASTDASGDTDDSVKYAGKIKGDKYEIICTEECEDFASINEDEINSEFSEESFDLADNSEGFGGENAEEDDIEFIEVGKDDDVNKTEIKVAETTITDDTILTWDTQQGDTLRELLTSWSNKAGWKLLWNTNRNYTLSAGAMFKGKFTDVSSALIRAFARARPAPIATFYKGNRVIVVETMENENAY